MADVLDCLDENTTDFWVNYNIPVLDCPSAVEFLREAYSLYHPVIIRGATSDWPALRKWDKDYLVESLGGDKVNINISTDGFGDCVKVVSASDIISSNSAQSDDYRECFVYPAECDMSISDFFTLLENRDPEYCVPYLSQQNDNLRSSFPSLMSDIQPLKFAEEAFGVTEPEAVNLWIGDERSVSSIHKDHYENMYAVIRGAKEFTLLPPTDVAYLPEHTYSTLRYTLVDPEKEGLARFAQSNVKLSSQDCPGGTLSWIPLDTEDPQVIHKYPKYGQAHPIRCTVLPGMCCMTCKVDN